MSLKGLRTTARLARRIAGDGTRRADAGRSRHGLGWAPAVIALTTAACMAAEPVPPVPPVLHVFAPAVIHANEPRDISVTVANHGATPVVVLPNMVRLRIDGERAQYVPYPGPPVDPWEGARELAGGASATVLFRDASDKRGVWRLPPGDYRVSALYEVPPDLAPPAALASPNRVWRGRVESEPVSMTVQPAR